MSPLWRCQGWIWLFVRLWQHPDTKMLPSLRRRKYSNNIVFRAEATWEQPASERLCFLCAIISANSSLLCYFGLATCLAKRDVSLSFAGAYIRSRSSAKKHAAATNELAMYVYLFECRNLSYWYSSNSKQRIDEELMTKRSPEFSF